MTKSRYPRDLVDTSVIMALECLNPEDLPVEFAVSAITVAELAASSHATSNMKGKARHQNPLAQKPS